MAWIQITFYHYVLKALTLYSEVSGLTSDNSSSKRHARQWIKNDPAAILHQHIVRLQKENIELSRLSGWICAASFQLRQKSSRRSKQRSDITRYRGMRPSKLTC